jgi:perosamine synthetase
MAIKLSHVAFPQEAVEAVAQLVRKGLVGQGSQIEEFEAAFGNWIGRSHAIAVSNGTMADTIALAALRARHPGKTKVIMPALTFAAQLNAVLTARLEPIFVDVDDKGLMRADQIEPLLDAHTLCIYPVHLLGAYCDLPDFGVPVVEDTCEALGTEYKGRKAGTAGTLATFSFFPSHTLTTGEGGMIATDDPELADLARTLRNHGKRANDVFHFDYSGFNGKMTTVQATLGTYGLRTLDKNIALRRKAGQALGLIERTGEAICPHAFPVVCASKASRDGLLEKLTEVGIESRNLFSSLSRWRSLSAIVVSTSHVTTA